MRIIQSNRLAVLADHLIAHWPRPPFSDLSPTRIVVPSLGMARWLTFRAASAFGICAQVEFVYPALYVWTLFADVLEGLSRRSPFDAETLAWRIYRALDEEASRPGFAPVAAYLQRGEARDRLALARRVAQMYAEILAVRPDWAPAWQRGELLHLAPVEHERWQALLWRRIALEISASAHPHPRDEFFAQLKARPELRSRLPQHVVVFGVAQMAPLYQRVFADLSRYTETTVYLVNPSDAFWFDLVSQRRGARAALTNPIMAASFDAGNPLLSSLGRQIQDNLAIWGLADEDRQQDDAVTVEDAFVAPDRTRLLGRIQHAIFSALPDDRPEALDAHDVSVQVHVCYSLARQLEVLHDQLLDALDHRDDDARLLPGEVLVMVPDLDRAAPLIEAVFGAAPAARHIAFTISGRSRDLATPVLAAFFSLLALPGSRFTFTQFQQLLGTASIASRLGLDDVQRDRITQWLEDAGVHWGVDGAARATHGVPATSHHTFASVIAALLMGYAISADEPVLVGDVIAFDGIEGKDAEILGSFIRFVQELVELSEHLSAAKTPVAWAATLRRMVEQFFDPRCDPLGEIGRLDVAISAALSPAIGVGIEEPLLLGVVLDAIRHALTQGVPGAVPGGGVTFAAFGPLRQIPYRLVCMIDLNGDGGFPRAPTRAEFDLLAQNPRPGDRNLYEEDRGAFLDGVQAATERLYLSYTGLSVRDNSVLAPSSVVDDLLDAAAQSLPEGRDDLKKLIVVHPLQPFSHRYFEGGALFSYAGELLPAASRERVELPPFIDLPLAEPDLEWRTVEIETLVKAIRNPIKFLLEQRLGLSLRDNARTAEDDEPIRLSPLDKIRLRERLYALHRAGMGADQLMATARAFAESPEGVLGDVALLPEIDAVDRFARAVAADQPAGLRSVPFRIARGPFVVTGNLEGLYRGGRFDTRLAMMNDLQLLRLWISHLLLHLVAADAHVDQPQSILICADYKISMEPVADAGAVLDELLAIYWQALREPVPLVPKLSYAFAAGGGTDQLYRTACTQWRGQEKGGTGYRVCEAREYRIVYRDILYTPPDGFQAVSKTVYDPLYASVLFERIRNGVQLEPSADDADPQITSDTGETA